jgi:hypothetical protein
LNEYSDSKYEIIKYQYFSFVASKKSKTPRRKSLARSKVFDGKTASEWNVVVNKRKIKKIKRQRAGMLNLIAPHNRIFVLYLHNKIEKLFQFF